MSAASDGRHAAARHGAHGTGYRIGPLGLDVVATATRDVGQAQMQALLAAYTAETGQSMASMSSYRSYSRQVDVYNGWVSSLGQEAADLTSARPGFSEHQTGWAMDLAAVPANCSGDQCFGQTNQGMWLAANSWKYGFIIRYPDGYTPITGYEYEPWHVR